MQSRLLSLCMFVCLGTTLLALGSGCDFNSDPPGSFAEFVRTQKEVKAALLDAGATISQKPYPILGSTNVVDLSQAETTDMDTLVELLKKLHKVSELNLSGATLTDEQFKRIGEIKTFFILNLSNTSITDKALNYFSKHTVLTDLDVTGTDVTKAGIAEMQALRKKEMPRYPPINVAHESTMKDGKPSRGKG